MFHQKNRVLLENKTKIMHFGSWTNDIQMPVLIDGVAIEKVN